MIKSTITALALALLLFGCSKKESLFSEKDAQKALEVCMEQYKAMAKSLPDYNIYPKTTSANDSSLVTCVSWNWTSGFFPGSLWYLYEYSADPFFLEQARPRTDSLQKEQYNKGTHDLGFMLYCSFGNGYRITGNVKYIPIMLTGAKSLSTRYRPNVKIIQSWASNSERQCPVIIDNMMNLEYLYWASKESGDSTFAAIATSHAKTTLKNHFRVDYSTYHMVDYDTLTGKAFRKKTVQGLSDESPWARGQSWGLYGYTTVFRETKDSLFLQQAQQIADYLLSHPNMPADLVPYWDFNAPGISDTLRDASAAAVMASVLLELSAYSKDEAKDRYHQAALKILASLSSDNYLAQVGTNNNFILKHSVGEFPKNSEVDVPLTYADYYYIEALMRYLGYTNY